MVEIWQSEDKLFVSDSIRDIKITVECKSIEEGLEKLEGAKAAKELIWKEERQSSYTPHPITIAQWIREYRNRLLAESDWTQVPDAQLSDDEREVWREYRQALRDVPQTWGLDGKAYSVDLSIVRVREDVKKLPWPSISLKENK